jgi:hypothetical protein
VLALPAVVAGDFVDVGDAGVQLVVGAVVDVVGVVFR